MPILVSLLGPSNAGKTTCAVRLTERWAQRGLRVGYLKHASHGFQMDRQRKDTHRVTHAGAVGVAATGPSGTAFLRQEPVDDPHRLVDWFFSDVDVVVLEGFRKSEIQAVVFLGRDPPDVTLATVTGPILAVIRGPESDLPDGVGHPVFSMDDEEGLAHHLEDVLGLPT